MKVTEQMLFREIGAISVIALKRLLWVNSGDWLYFEVWIKEEVEYVADILAEI